MSASARIIWHGHAAVQVIAGGVNLLVDPFFSHNPACPRSWQEIEKPDAVLVTHDHGDHTGDAIEICSVTKAPLLCVVGTGQKLMDEGLPPALLANGIGFNIGGSLDIKGASVTMTQAFHSSDSGVPVGYVATMPGGFTFYHAGDTGIFSSMSLIGDLYPLDLAILPIGGVFTMDARQAARACALLRAPRVLPIHWGTFPVLDQSLDTFRRELAVFAPNCELIGLQAGESTLL